jgi:hypothetical protein
MSAPETSTSVPPQLDFNAIAQELRAQGMKVQEPGDLTPTVTSADAVQQAAAEEGVGAERQSAQVLLALWAPDERADVRLTWIVRFSGLSIPSRGPGPATFNKEANAFIDAKTGKLVATISYR